MNEIDKNNGKRHREKILHLIKQKDTSLAELKKNTSRQSVLYHIPKLCKENLIRAYIKGNGLKDEDIFYTFVNLYEYPQDVLKLINEMCDLNTTQAAQAFTNFISLCIEKGMSEKMATRIAYALMSGYIPRLKEQIAFHLPQKKDSVPWSYLIKGLTYHRDELHDCDVDIDGNIVPDY